MSAAKTDKAPKAEKAVKAPKAPKVAKTAGAKVVDIKDAPKKVAPSKVNTGSSNKK
jgi:hypothetical protein